MGLEVSETPVDVERLLAHARAVREHAYAPHSGFRVGAAVLSEDGTVHVGCNVENASYGLTMCAERSAVAAAVAAGCARLRAIVISVDGDQPVAPCGACRQVLGEFAADLRVISEASGHREEWNLSALLPVPFREVPGRP